MKVVKWECDICKVEQKVVRFSYLDENEKECEVNICQHCITDYLRKDNQL